MKKRFLSMALALVMMLSLLPTAAFASSTNPFSDVKAGDWFCDEVLYVKDNGLMNGTSASAFNPGGNTTRGMIVTILHRLAGQPAAAASTFQDVADDQYYADAVDWAAANGVVTGYTAAAFGPNDFITREQLAAIFYRYASLMGYDVSVGEDTNILSWPDALSVSPYAVSAMQWAVGAGLVNGSDGKLAPQGLATRAQVAAILYRFCTQVVEDAAPVTHTVTLILNDGTSAVYKTITAEDGKTITAPRNPARSGYHFGGWFTSAEGGKLFDFSAGITGDVTLYAHWSKVVTHKHSYSIVNNQNGTHSKVCRCDRTITEACDNNGENGACSVCGDTTEYVASHSNGLKYKTLAEAVAIDGTVTLLRDISLTEALTITDKNVTITDCSITSSGEYGLVVKGTSKVTLQNITVTGTQAGIRVEDTAELTVGADAAVSSGKADTASSGDGIRAYGSSKLTILGTVNGNGSNGSGFELYQRASADVRSGANVTGGGYGVTLYGGSLTSAGNLTGTNDTGILTSAMRKDGTLDEYNGEISITITGGTVAGTGTIGDTGYSIYLCSKKAQTISISGGTIIGKNIANCTGGASVTASITGGTFSTDPSVYVADGYTALPSSSNWVVTENSSAGYAADSAEELSAAAAQAGAAVTMTESVAAGEKITLNGGSLNGGDQTLTFDAQSSDATTINVGISAKDGADVSNLKIVDKTDVKTSGGETKALRAIYLEGTGEFVVSNVNIVSNGYALNTGSITGESKLTVTNSTLAGWTSFAGVTPATFTNCKFTNEGQTYQYIRTYVAVTFDGCTFAPGYTLDFADGKEGKITLTNCYAGDTLLTVDNAQELLNMDDDTFAKVNFSNP